VGTNRPWAATLLHSEPIPAFTNNRSGCPRCLPIEILLKVFLETDLFSIFRLRQINRQAREVVNSFAHYRKMIKYGLNAYRALLITQKALKISLHDFHVAFSVTKCIVCGDIGDLMYLPSWSRCCRYCLVGHRRFRLCAFTPVCKLLPYGIGKMTAKRLLIPLRVTHTRAQLGADHVVSIEYSKHVFANNADITDKLDSMVEQSLKYRQKAACHLPFYDATTRKIGRPVNCLGCLPLNQI